MDRNIIENLDEKIIETFSRMSNKNDVNEFKEAFKGKYDQEWDKIYNEFKDEEPQDGVQAPEKYLEDQYQKHRNKIES